MKKPISILGGGNAGHTMAADITLGGYDVIFYEHPKFKAAFENTLKNGVIDMEDVRDGRHAQAKIYKVTTDIREAVNDVKLILVAVPAFGQELFFNTMVPYLQEGQVVCLMTGNFGSLRLSMLLREKAPGRNILICETNTMPYGTRIVAPSKISLSYGFGPWVDPNARIEDMTNPYVASALPATDTHMALSELNKIYPLYSGVKNILVSALSNSNMPLHTVGVMLNAGRIEYSKNNFYLYREGLGPSPSVLRAVEAVNSEIISIIEALGARPTMTYKSLCAYIDYLVKPNPSDHLGAAINGRYITEDVPYGLVPASELGKKLGIETSLIDAFIKIAGIMNKEDYYKTGRGLKSLGLEGLDKEQILDLVERRD
jgi:opine dehydrogenase